MYCNKPKLLQNLAFFFMKIVWVTLIYQEPKTTNFIEECILPPIL